jgi:hypothetical protein
MSDDPTYLSRMGQFLKGGVAGLGSVFLNDPSQPGVAGYVPKIAADTYGLVDLLAKAGHIAGRVVAGPGLPPPPGTEQPGIFDNLVSLPGAETAAQISDNVRRNTLMEVAGAPRDRADNILQNAGYFGALLPVGGPLKNASLPVKLGAAMVSPVSPFGAKGLATDIALASTVGGAVGTLGDMPEAAAAPGQGEQPPAPAPTPEAPTADGTVFPLDLSLSQPEQSNVAQVPTEDGVVFNLDLPPSPSEAVRSPSDWTYGDIGIAMLSAGAVVAGIGAATRLWRARSVDNFEQMSAKYNADQAQRAANPAQAMTGDAVVPPVPGAAPTDRAVETMLDSAGPLKKSLTAMGDEDTAARVGLLSNESAVVSRMQWLYDTGVDNVSGRRFMPLREHSDKLVQLKNVDESAYELYSRARYAADELDNRMTNNGVRHNFPDVDSNALSQIVADARRIPAVNTLLDEAKQFTDNFTQWMVHRGLIGQGEAAQFRNMHPNYLPSANFEGLIDNPLTRRDVSRDLGINQIPVHAAELQKQHFEAVFRAAEDNLWKRDVLKSYTDFQNANPQRAQLVKVVATPTNIQGQAQGAAKDRQFINVRNDQGQLVTYEIMSPDVHRWLTQVGGHRAHEYLRAQRSLMESFTTGRYSWLTGNVMAPLIAAYNGSISSVVRPKGMSYGLVDTALQKVTGGRVGLPGDVSGTLIGQPVAAAIDAGAMISERIARMLHPDAQTPLNSMLRTLLPDQMVDAMALNARDRYMRSQYAERRKLGLVGSAGMDATNVPNIQSSIAPGAPTSALNNMTPELFRGYDPKIPMTNLTIPTPGRTLGIKTDSLIGELHRLITESHASWAYRVNKGRMPQEQLVHQVRRLTGDPSEVGTSRVMQAANAAIPYFAPSVQGTRRVGQAIADQPLSTGMGIFNAVVLPVLGSVYLAMLSGDDAIDYMINETNSDRFASRVSFMWGDPLRDRVDFAVDPVMRPVMAAAKSFAVDLFLSAARSDPDSFSDAINVLTDLFSKHLTTQQLDNIGGAATSVVEPGLPPAARAASIGAAGKDLPAGWLHEVFQGKNPMIDVATQRSIPGAVRVSDPIFGADMQSQYVKAAMAMLGMAGSQLPGLVDTFNYSNMLTDDPIYAMSNVRDQWLMQARDSLPTANALLWKHEFQASPRSTFVEQVQKKVAAMTELAGTRTAEMLGGQVTRNRGRLLDPGTQMEDKLPPDPEMRQLHAQLGGFNNTINKMNQQAIDVRKQLDALNTTGRPVNMLRTERNALTREYHHQMSELAGFLNYVEAFMSQAYGRRINVDNIDWKGTMDQFKQLD